MLKSCDVLCAGIPCQSFSLMGRKDAMSNLTTSNLVNEFMRMANIISLKVIILENFRQFKKIAFNPNLVSFPRENGYNSIDTGLLNCRMFVCVGVLRPSQQRDHVEPVSYCSWAGLNLLNG